MLQLEELKQALLAQQPKIQDLREALGCDKLLEEKKKLDEEAASPDFWNDMENTRRVLKEQKVVNEKLDSYNSLVSMFEDAQTMVELAGEEEFGSEEEQEAFLRDIRDNLKEIDARIEEEKLSALLSGEFDSNNAILTFHAGAGGTEAQAPAGRSATTSRSRCWTIWPGRRRASRARRSSSPVPTPTAF